MRDLTSKSGKSGAIRAFVRRLGIRTPSNGSFIGTELLRQAMMRVKYGHPQTDPPPDQTKSDPPPSHISTPRTRAEFPFFSSTPLEKRVLLANPESVIDLHLGKKSAGIADELRKRRGDYTEKEMQQIWSAKRVEDALKRHALENFTEDISGIPALTDEAARKNSSEDRSEGDILQNICCKCGDVSGTDEESYVPQDSPYWEFVCRECYRPAQAMIKAPGVSRRKPSRESGRRVPWWTPDGVPYMPVSKDTVLKLMSRGIPDCPQNARFVQKLLDSGVKEEDIVESMIERITPVQKEPANIPDIIPEPEKKDFGKLFRAYETIGYKVLKPDYNILKPEHVVHLKLTPEKVKAGAEFVADVLAAEWGCPEARAYFKDHPGLRDEFEKCTKEKPMKSMEELLKEIEEKQKSMTDDELWADMQKRLKGLDEGVRTLTIFMFNEREIRLWLTHGDFSRYNRPFKAVPRATIVPTPEIENKSTEGLGA